MIENQSLKLISQADDHYYAAEYAQAISLYEKALTFDPTNLRAITQIAKAKEVLALPEDSKRIPSEAMKFYRRSRSHITARVFPEAMAGLITAIDIARLAGVRFTEAEQMLLALREEIKLSKFPRVFISYSRDDFEVAGEIYSFLHANDCIPWMDTYDLVPGQDWEFEIRHNIKESDFFVACLSYNSVSKRGYVQKELKYAISILDEFPEGEIYIIPVRLAECTVPVSLSSKQWLDWFAPNAKDQLIKAIQSKK